MSNEPINPDVTDEQIVRLAYQHLTVWDEDHIRFARAVLALAAPKAVAQGWIKIEEDAEVDVPLDTVVLLAWWDEWSEEWKIEANYAGSERGGWRHGRATHWQPLPASPSEEEKA